jgi:hypothetical protein
MVDTTAPTVTRTARSGVRIDSTRFYPAQLPHPLAPGESEVVGAPSQPPDQRMTEPRVVRRYPLGLAGKLPLRSRRRSLDGRPLVPLMERVAVSRRRQRWVSAWRRPPSIGAVLERRHRLHQEQQSRHREFPDRPRTQFIESGLDPKGQQCHHDQAVGETAPPGIYPLDKRRGPVRRADGDSSGRNVIVDR